MKVLWFTHVPLPAMIRAAEMPASGIRGHWISQLLDNIASADHLELAVVTAYPGLTDTPFTEKGVKYYPVSQPARFPVFSTRKRDIERCVSIVNDFQPDLVHFHGSERFYGELKAAKLISTPSVVSIQGILGPCSTWRNFFGALTPLDILRSTRLIELPLKLGLGWQYLNQKQGARREARILSSVEGLLGRTDWDNAYATHLNPDALYCHVGEVLRPSFSEARWLLEECERYSIFFSNAGHPRRGTEILLDAVALLRKEFPGIRLRLAGHISERSGYGRFLRRKLGTLDLLEHVELLGFLDEQSMVKELLRAHTFAITSYIENSPNSLAEAMIVGMPCVANFVGGVPSMISDGNTGSLTTVGDAPLLAHKIRSIFSDDQHARQLGVNARLSASTRHDPATVTNQLIDAYQAVLERVSICR
jgi:glycosyltransferase involved in cell wall biosynthesis